MASYVVGDIQGCFDSLIALLDQVNFDAENDTLYCVGDLVNRGPKSLKTLRFLKSIGESAKIVLGNHDLHLISVYYGIRELNRKDTLHKILTAKDAEELIVWLKSQPLMIHDKTQGFVISHAGIYPNWSIKRALKNATELSNALQGDDFKKVLKKMYGNEPVVYNKKASRFKRFRFIVNSFTRMRFCTHKAELNFTLKTSPQLSNKQESKLVPWFELPHKRPNDILFLFGHWSALGLFKQDNIICLDSGCVWGNKLSLYDIDQQQFVSVKPKEPK